MKSTTKRFSLGIKIASILTCLVLTAVGFASWLIIKPAEDATKDGSFMIYKVDTSEVTLEVESTNSSIVFGKTDTTYENPWLVATDVAAEALTATFTVTASTGDDASVKLNSVADKIQVTFSIAEACKDAFDAAIGDYIAKPVVSIKSGETVKATANYENAEVVLSVDAEASNTQTFTVEIVFDWGTKTGGDNPYDYFNTKEATAENIALAQDVLTKVFNIKGSEGTLDQAFNLKIATVVEEENAG